MTKIKNIILINMLLGATSVAYAANDKLPNGKPFVLLNDQIVEVENTLQALEDKYDDIITDIYTSIEGLNGKISAINLKIDELEETDTQLQEKIAQTIADLESQGSDIKTLFENYQTLQVQLEALEASVVTKAELEALEAEIETVRSSIAAVSTEVAGLLLDIEDNTALIELLQQDMKNLTVAMESAIPQGECSQGQFLSAINEDGSIACSNSDNSGANSTITTLISSPIEVSKNTVVSVDLACGTNQQVISGGFNIEDSQEGFNVVQSLPWNNGWRVMIKTDGNWKGGSLSVHAICMSN